MISAYGLNHTMALTVTPFTVTVGPPTERAEPSKTNFPGDIEVAMLVLPACSKLASGC